MENLLFEINKSVKPLIYGFVQEEKYYKISNKKKRADKSAQYRFLKVRSLLRSSEYQKYLLFEKKAKINIFKQYVKNDRFILFLHYVLNLGRRKIHKKTGISERYIRNLLSEK